MSNWLTHLKEVSDAPGYRLEPSGPASNTEFEETGGIWSALKARTNPYSHCPQKNSHVLTRRLQDGKEPYYVIKNPYKKTYLRLSEGEFSVFEKMDGKTSIQDLIVEYYLERGKFAHRMILSLVEQLHRASMLERTPISAWSQVRAQLGGRSWSSRLSAMARWLLTNKLSLKGIDGIVGWLYRSFFRIFFTRPFQLIFLLVSVFGLFAFFQLIRDQNAVFLEANIAAGVGLWWLATVPPIVIHELGHALTVKHFGREVPRGGLMLFFGLPAAFVETTDIWMEPRRARLAVTWNGPYTGLIIGGMLSLYIATFPSASLNPFFLKMASVAYATVFFNVNPLLKYDGYYLLADALDIPNLREKSLAFVKNRFLRGDTGFSSFSRVEWIYTIYGVLTILWMGYALSLAAFFWQTRLREGLAAILGPGYPILARLVGLLMLAGLLSLSILIGLRLVGFVRALLNRLLQSGLFTRFNRLAAILAVTAAVVGFLSHRILPDRVAGMGAAFLTAIAGFFVMRLGRTYSRSRRQLAMLCFGSGTILLAAWRTVPGLIILLWVGVIMLLAGGLLLELRLVPLRDLIVVPISASGITGLILYGFGISFFEPPFWLILSLTIMGTRSYLAIFRSARCPAVMMLFGGGILTVLSWSLPSLSVFSQLLLAGGGIHLLLVRLPSIRAKEVDDVSVTHLVVGGSMSVIVQRLCSQIYFESGLPGVVHMAEDFSSHMRSNNLNLSIEGIRFIDPDLSSRSAGEIRDVYGLALDSLYLYMARAFGKKITRNTFESGMDLLPWQNREVISDMVLGRRFWGLGLAQGGNNSAAYFREMLRHVPLFEFLADEALDEIAHRLVEEKFGVGEVVITEGQVGDKFYIVSSGKISVFQKGKARQQTLVEYLGRGQFFGEQALVSDQPRNATVKTVTPATLFSMKRSAFNALVRHYISVNENLNRGAQHSWLLRGMPIFDDLESHELDWLSLQMQVENYAKGDVIFREGDAGNRFYLVESGSVAVIKSLNGKKIPISRRGPGEYFGEIALLQDRPRTATLAAESDLVLLSLAGPQFQELVAGHESLAKAVRRTGSRRYKYIEKSIKRAETT